jgi:hypothetical protein
MLQLHLYNNTALVGEPASARQVPLSDLGLPSGAPFSALAWGSLSVVRGTRYEVSCEFAGITLAILLIDDHIVCQTGTNSPPLLGDDQLRGLSRPDLAVRLMLLSATPAPVRAAVSIRAAGGASPPPLVPWLSASEEWRRRLQEGLLRGWGLFHSQSFLTHVLLPEAAYVTVGLCDTRKGECELRARTDCYPVATACERPPRRPPTRVRLGSHAYDRSFGSLHLWHRGCNVSLTFGGGQELLLLARRVSEGEACADHVLVAVGGGLWHRRVDASVTRNSLRLSPLHLPASTVHATRHSSAAATAALPPSVSALPHLAFEMGGRDGRRSRAGGAGPRSAGGRRLGSAPSGDVPGTPVEGDDSDAAPPGAAAHAPAVGFCTSRPCSVAGLEAELARRRSAEEARYARYGAEAEIKAAVQAAIMWNMVKREWGNREPPCTVCGSAGFPLGRIPSRSHKTYTRLHTNAEHLTDAAHRPNPRGRCTCLWSRAHSLP